MKSLYRFIVKPLSDRYDNTKRVGDKDLILNTNIENHSFISKRALVVSVPINFTTSVKVGDEVLIHHNIFRRWYDMKGKEKNSASYFKDDLYFCDIGQLYLCKKGGDYYTNLDYCFIKPLKGEGGDKEKPLTGVVKYSNSYLSKFGVNIGDVVTFKPESEFEFLVDYERLYCMKLNDIVIKHEYKGNEEEYNPSWANSS